MILSSSGYVYEIRGKPINPPPGKIELDTNNGEAKGKNKSRFEIANLKPEYKYTIKLYAKTGAGQVRVEKISDDLLRQGQFPNTEDPGSGSKFYITRALYFTHIFLTILVNIVTQNRV